MMKSSKYILISAIIVLLLTIRSQDAFCQWHDNSGDPHDMSSSSGTGYLIAAAGLVVIGGIVYLILRPKKKKTQSTSCFMENESGDTPCYTCDGFLGTLPITYQNVSPGPVLEFYQNSGYNCYEDECK